MSNDNDYSGNLGKLSCFVRLGNFCCEKWLARNGYAVCAGVSVIAVVPTNRVQAKPSLPVFCKMLPKYCMTPSSIFANLPLPPLAFRAGFAILSSPCHTGNRKATYGSNFEMPRLRS
jgi:hypothetical protein